jgi:hypothetical protein
MLLLNQLKKLKQSSCKKFFNIKGKNYVVFYL